MRRARGTPQPITRPSEPQRRLWTASNGACKWWKVRRRVCTPKSSSLRADRGKPPLSRRPTHGCRTCARHSRTPPLSSSTCMWLYPALSSSQAGNRCCVRPVNSRCLTPNPFSTNFVRPSPLPSPSSSTFPSVAYVPLDCAATDQQNLGIAKHSAALLSQSDAVNALQKEEDARKLAERKAAEQDAIDQSTQFPPLSLRFCSVSCWLNACFVCFVTLVLRLQSD
jgi:hypothetical protein